MKRMIALCLAAMFCSQALCLYAQEEGTPVPAPAAKDANNPLASIKSVSVHNVWSPSLYGAEGSANTTWIRYAQPIGRVLVRASLPVNSLGGRSGLGDLNVFATWVATRPTARNQFGFGPIIGFPTATSRILGSGKWSAGVAIVAYFVPNAQFQAGILATWQHSFAGNSGRNTMHAASFQPLLMWQLGKGTYLRSTGIVGMDFANDIYFIPVGLGAGKVFTAGKVTFNLFIEPQFTAWYHGASVPKLQLFAGINTQF